MASNSDIMIIIGTKMKYLSRKENEHGHNHFFNVTDIAPLQQLIDLRKSLEIPIWDYNDKFYLGINDIKIRELLGEIEFKKDVHYIMDSFSKYDFEKKGEQITGYSIFEINTIYQTLKYREMGLSESALKPFSCLSHCKVSFDSPRCESICGKDNRCNCNIDTHEYVICDSEEEHIEK